MYWNDRMIYRYTCKLDRIKLRGRVIGWLLINLDLLTPFLEKFEMICTDKVHAFNSGHSEDIPGTEVLHEERQMSGWHGSSDSSQRRLFIQYTESHTEALSTQWGGKGEKMESDVPESKNEILVTEVTFFFFKISV